MLLVTHFQRCACAALLATVGLGSLGHAADLPDYMQPIAGVVTVSPTEVANDNLLALNRSMFQLYDETGKLLQRNILAQHPVILGLFSGAGGRFILYRPGMAPLEAPPVPIVYQLLKSVGHSTMAVSEVVAPYIDNFANQAWLASLLAYRSQMQSALDTLDRAELPPDRRAVPRTILQNNVAFMDNCAKKGAITMAEIQDFAKRQGPSLKKVIAWAAQT